MPPKGRKRSHPSICTSHVRHMYGTHNVHTKIKVLCTTFAVDLDRKCPGPAFACVDLDRKCPTFACVDQ